MEFKNKIVLFAAEANLCPFINHFNETKFEIFLGILFRAYWEIKLCLKLS